MAVEEGKIACRFLYVVVVVREGCAAWHVDLRLLASFMQTKLLPPLLHTANVVYRAIS